jgi:hypothetical protein
MKPHKVKTTIITYKLESDITGWWNAYCNGKQVATGRTLYTCRQNALEWSNARTMAAMKAELDSRKLKENF